ncbi:MAG: hypothetical protein HC923_12575 [Myxococcales bacterium]|nr:hypothetical protein [Myxococcales bacterium]
MAASRFVLLMVCGCGGTQSALRPAGVDAAEIARLFWWMTVGGFAIWAAVLSLALLSVTRPEIAHERSHARLLIVGGGVAFPTVVLAVLLVFGLRLMPRLLAEGDPTLPKVQSPGSNSGGECSTVCRTDEPSSSRTSWSFR